MRGFPLPHAKFSLQLVKFLLRYAMGIIFGMCLSAFWVSTIQKCVVVIFAKFELACVHITPLRYLDVPYLFRAHVP